MMNAWRRVCLWLNFRKSRIWCSARYLAQKSYTQGVCKAVSSTYTAPLLYVMHWAAFIVTFLDKTCSRLLQLSRYF
jgi:hypothetical protein